MGLSRLLVCLLQAGLALGALGGATRLALAEPAGQTQDRDLLLAIQSRLRVFETLEGKFEQEKRLAKIRKPLKSRGRFALKRQLGVVWRTDAPIQSLLVMTRDTVRVVKNGRTVTSVDLSEQPGLRLMGELVISVFAADVERLRKTFHVTGGQAKPNEPWKVTLEPRDSGVAKVIRRISLSGTEHVDTLEIVERNTDVTHIRFTDLDSDHALADEDERLLRQSKK